MLKARRELVIQQLYTIFQLRLDHSFGVFFTGIFLNSKIEFLTLSDMRGPPKKGHYSLKKGGIRDWRCTRVKGENTSTWILQATASLLVTSPQRISFNLECIHLKKKLQWTKNASWIDKLTILPNSSTQQLGIWRKKHQLQEDPSVSQSAIFVCPRHESCVGETWPWGGSRNGEI